MAVKTKQFTGKRRDKPAGISEKVINILKILNLIEQGKYPSVRRLAQECEVTERSVHRYLRITDAVVPVTYDRVKGGYAFSHKGIQKIVPFKKEEIAILAAISEMVSKIGEPVKGYFQGIRDKIFACANPQIRDGSNIPIRLLSSPGAAHAEWKWFDTVMEALQDARQIRINYRAVNADKLTERVIEPYGLVFHDGIWFVYAFCLLRKAFRWFALDRIENAEIMARAFTRQEGFNLEERLKGAWGIWEGGGETDIVVRFSPDIAEVIRRKPFWHSSEKRKELPDGGIELAFKLSAAEELKWWLLSWMPYVRVVKPASLREEIKNILVKGLANQD
ncbi:MAG: WYL domain-containing protein [Deltaproteobacteria bacterium]|nr:WYL domain-containing protein [Deltaproteobacteria bacterium]